jgi:hypothetical protein
MHTHLHTYAQKHTKLSEIAPVPFSSFAAAKKQPGESGAASPTVLGLPSQMLSGCRVSLTQYSHNDKVYLRRKISALGGRYVAGMMHAPLVPELWFWAQMKHVDGNFWH